MREPTPVTVLTGFLGSGKTTLLNALLARPEFADTAVLINEFGEVAIDHHLVRKVDERVLLLEGGCICCAVLGDLAGALREPHVRAAKRVLIETTGMADPSRLLATLSEHTEITAHYALARVVVTADAEHALLQLSRYPEAARQLAAADVIVVTKTDRVDAQRVASLREELARLNPLATITDAEHGALDSTVILDRVTRHAALSTPTMLSWKHDPRVKTFSVTLDHPIRWSSFSLWSTLLVEFNGDSILRIKGLLNLVEEPLPQVFHVVQHVRYPLAQLDAWPDGDARSRLVFITRGMDNSTIKQTLDALRAIAQRP